MKALPIDDLIQSAQESIRFRGHTEPKDCWQQTYGKPFAARNARRVWLYECAVCGKHCQVDTKPPPNGIDIGGPAVALGCSDSKD